MLPGVNYSRFHYCETCLWDSPTNSPGITSEISGIFENHPVVFLSNFFFWMEEIKWCRQNTAETVRKKKLADKQCSRIWAWTAAQDVTHSQGQAPISCMFSHICEDPRTWKQWQWRECITQWSSRTSGPAESKGLMPGFWWTLRGLK